MSGESASYENFSSDLLEINLARLPSCEVSLEITTKPALIKKAKEEAIKTVRKEVEVPGFRKGKAPQSFIEKNFHKTIDSETKESLCQLAVNEAFKLTQIYPFDKGAQLSLKNFKMDGEKASMNVSFETFPLVPEVDLKTIKIEKVDETPVTDEEVDEIFQNLQREKASYKSLEEKPLTINDSFDLSIETMDGQKLLDNQRYRATKDLSPGLLDLIIGMKSKDFVENIEFQKIYQGDVEENAPLVKITVEAVYEETLPEINDEFAKSYGADSLEDMRKKVFRRRELEKKEYAFQSQVSKIKKQLLEDYSFEIPEKRIQTLIDELWEKQLNKWKEDKVSLAPEEIASEKLKFEEVQKAKFKTSLLIDKLIDKNTLELTKEEIGAEMQPLFSFHQDFPFLMKLMGDEKELDRELTARAWDRKIGKFLIDQVTLI